MLHTDNTSKHKITFLNEGVWGGGNYDPNLHDPARESCRFGE